MLGKSRNLLLQFVIVVVAFSVTSRFSRAELQYKNSRNISAKAPVESLQDFTKRQPFFLSNQSHAHFVAARCSALYLVLSSRIEEIPKAKDSKDLNNLNAIYNQRASIYDDSRLLLNKTIEIKQNSLEAQKEYAIFYGELTLSNWKLHNNIFAGMVESDLRVCEENFIHYKKLSLSLSN